MHVIATAGHVDHGKSTLVRALTGSDPDRLEEERRRGLTIQLGYAWTTLTAAGKVVFVDVPGHERFLRTMLSGVGPVPAVLLVVAADDPWMPQAAEHLAALDALGVAHGVVAVSRCDLADPAEMVARARAEVDRTSLRGAPVVPVSGVSGAGLDALRDALAEMLVALPTSDPDADVRIWVDRMFHVKGSGTVLTGTLPAGTVRVGDRLATDSGAVRVRAVQALGEHQESVSGVARVALNVVPEERTELARDSVLVTSDRWHHTDTFDVRLVGAGAPPLHPLLHIGAMAVPVRVRMFDEAHARLAVERPLPLRIGDRALLRDPGSREVWGVRVLDPAPPSLRRRGAGARRAHVLTRAATEPDLDAELARRGVASAALLRRIGVAVPAEARPWLVGERAASLLSDRMAQVVQAHDAAHPLDPGMPTAAVARALRLPSPDLVGELVPEGLHAINGQITSVAPRAGLPPEVESVVCAIEAALATEPFVAPTADQLREIGATRQVRGTAVRAGRLLDLGDGIVLLPDADRVAAQRLAALPQPFTTSEARKQLGTSRRVALPLLAHLDRTGLTIRHPDDRRSVR